MKIIYTVIKITLYWFISYLIIFLLLTLITLIVSSVVGETFNREIQSIYKVYCAIAFLYSSTTAYIISVDIKLIQLNTLKNVDDKYKIDSIENELL